MKTSKESRKAGTGQQVGAIDPNRPFFVDSLVLQSKPKIEENIVRRARTLRREAPSVASGSREAGSLALVNAKDLSGRKEAE